MGGAGLSLTRRYLNDVEHNVLVEAVQDALGDSVVIPGTMNHQQILQIFELGEERKDISIFLFAVSRWKAVLVCFVAVRLYLSYGVIRRVGCLQTFIAAYPNPHVGRLYHADVIGAISNRKCDDFDLFLNHLNNLGLLKRRNP